MVLRTVLTALLALRALSSASLALLDACRTEEGGRVRVGPLSAATALSGWVGEWVGVVALYHAGHHHVAVGLCLLLGQLGLGAAQLVHHFVHLLVQPGCVLVGLFGILLRLGRTLRRRRGCIIQCQTLTRGPNLANSVIILGGEIQKQLASYPANTTNPPKMGCEVADKRTLT